MGEITETREVTHSKKPFESVKTLKPVKITISKGLIKGENTKRIFITRERLLNNGIRICLLK